MIRREEVQAAIGEVLDEIKDENLREKVLATWMLAIERGEWKCFSQIEKMPFTLAVDAGGIGMVEHTLAVTRGAMGLGRAQTDAYAHMPYHIDTDRLIAGGLLHDIGKLLEYELDGEGNYVQSHTGRCARHPVSGALLAGEVGLPDELINIIACHAKEGEGRPQVVETVLIHQTDFACFNPMVMLSGGKLIR